MTITDLKIENNNIIIFVDNLSSYIPYIMRRVSPDLWKYHDKRFPIKQSSQMSFSIDAEVLFTLFDLSASYCICDIICFNDYTEDEKGLYFADGEQFKTFTATLEYEKSFGKISAIFYTNGSNSLSVRLKIIPKCILKIIKLSEDCEYINFRLKHDVDFKDVKLYLACRENTNHDFCYRAFIPISLSTSNNKKYSYFRITKQSFFKNTFIKNGDIFDFIVIAGQYRLPCYTESNDINTNYFTIRTGLEACFFISDDKYPSLYVRANYITNTTNKIKVAILGSCFTKEAFHSLDYLNPDYKLFYENGLIGFHQSIISVVSNPIKYNKEDFISSLDKKLIELYGDKELSKKFLAELDAYKANYLIIDLYIEASASIYEISDHCYLTDSFYFRGTPLIKNLHPKRKFLISCNERFDLFKQALIKFRNQVEKIIPLDKIILVKARRATSRIDNGVVSKWPEYDYIKYANMVWDKCDEMFEQIIPEARIIDMRDDKKYLSQRQSPLTYSPQHLVSSYYKDLLNKFNKIVLFDLLNDSNGVSDV